MNGRGFAHERRNTGASYAEGDGMMKWSSFISRLAAALLLAAGCMLAVPDVAAEAVEDDVHLLIDLSERRLYVMLNDTPVYRFPVATGRKTRPTPTGTFRIVTKVVNPYYLPKQIPGGHPDNPLGTRWMGLNIGGGYKYGIHGTHKPYLIGQPVSSGCIRMRNKDVEFLYRHIPLRTTVIITDRN
jgi:lipoprotein-anchoring transpeptidase ErfK/SrfK